MWVASSLNRALVVWPQESRNECDSRRMAAAGDPDNAFGTIREQLGLDHVAQIKFDIHKQRIESRLLLSVEVPSDWRDEDIVRHPVTVKPRAQQPRAPIAERRFGLDETH